MGDRTRDVTRLEQILEHISGDAAIKLSAVASSLSTVSARAMLGAMVAGQRDPTVLAELAKGKMRGKIPQLREALEGASPTPTPDWSLKCCTAWTGSSRHWPSSMS